MKPIEILGSVALALLFSALLTAQTSASVFITNDGDGTLRDSETNTFTLGYTFTIGAKDLLVTGLGIWDDDALDTQGMTGTTNGTPDGIVESNHQVAIWKVSDSSLITSVSGASVQAGSLIGEFRYAATTATLQAGVKYMIGAYYQAGTADLWHNVDGVNTATTSDATINQYGFTLLPTFTIPDSFAVSLKAFVGPTFSYEVPEPSVACLIAPAAMLVAGARRRKGC